jgi:hypothetical protein
MEMLQGNSLYSYLKQTKNVIFFLFYKIREQEGRTGPVLGEFGTSGRGEDVGRRCRR